MYYERLIDNYLFEWSLRKTHKPVLLRGARQVGKSTAVRNLGKKFENFVEINFEKQPEYKHLFQVNLDVVRIVSQMSAMCGKPIKAGKTLLFFDEIQTCKEAIMSLRFFKEDLPELHIIAAGSLLEFALSELPTFVLGEFIPCFMYPMTFDEFLKANGEQLLLEARNSTANFSALPAPIHEKLVKLLRTYMLVGSMPEVVAKWVESNDFLQCHEIQDDIIISYEDDFSKYKDKTDPMLLRLTMRAVEEQATKKFTYSQVGGGYKTEDVKKALEMLILAGIITPVTRSSANGLPLGSDTDKSYRKMLLLDTGLMLRLLNMTMGDITQLTTHILTASASELVNKGSMAEQIVGLEILRYQSPNIRHDLYYWTRQSKNSQTKINYVIAQQQNVMPIEVKAETQGGMKSLWIFMREKKTAKCNQMFVRKFWFV